MTQKVMPVILKRKARSVRAASVMVLAAAKRISQLVNSPSFLGQGWLAYGRRPSFRSTSVMASAEKTLTASGHVIKTHVQRPVKMWVACESV